MSSASDILDPVEAAQDDITRSKHLIASTLDDLTRHHSWLESYHRDERRRAERLRRQEALHQLELKRQRASWMLRRSALTSLAVTRATASFLVRNSIAFVSWTAPRLHALTLLSLRLLSAGLSWSWRTAHSLAREGFEASTIALAWTVRASDAVGVAFRRRVSAGFSVLSAKAAIVAAPGLERTSIGWARVRRRGQRFVITLRRRASDCWSWMRTKTPDLAHSLVASIAAGGRIVRHSVHDKAIAGAAWTHTRSSQLTLAAARMASDGWSRFAARTRRVAGDASLQHRALQHRALIVRRSTALISVEPWRPRLPAVVRAG